MSVDLLTDELLLQVLGFLSPYDVYRVRTVSRRFLALGNDDGLWRTYCERELHLTAKIGPPSLSLGVDEVWCL
jgi:hypothetical protein